MTGVAARIPRLTFIDIVGRPLAGGSVDVYAAGTTTRATTWTDVALTVPNQNPIPLDGNGSCVAYLVDGSFYKMVVHDVFGVTEWTQDNIEGGGVDGSIELGAAALQASVDAVAHIYPGTFAVAPTTRPDGSAIQAGDEYFGTDGFTYVRVGVTWVNQTSAAAASALAASGSAAAAGTSASAAAASQAAAGTSAASASSSAALAATGAKFFDTIALGRAGVADGASFGVLAGGADGLTRPTVYRREAAGGQTPLFGVLPASDFDSVFMRLLSSAPGYALAFTDQYLRVAAGIADDGTFQAARINAQDLLFTRINNALLQMFSLRTQFVFGDPRNAAVVIDETGALNSAKTQVKVGLLESGEVQRLGGTWSDATHGMQGSAERILPEIAYCTSYGQSNAVLSTGQVNNAYDTVTFSADRLSLVAITAPFSTVMSGWQELLKQRVTTEDGLSTTQMPYQLLATATGEGSQPISALSKGGAYYARILADLADGMTRATALGKTFKFETVSWAQGEADASNDYATYRVALEKLVSDLAADATAATGQTDPPLFIIWQIKGASRAASLGQLDVAKRNRNVCIAMPSYFLETIGDDTHAAATIKGSFLMGAYFGLAHKRYKVDGKKVRPLMPAAYFRQGKTLIVRFNMPAGGKLVLDTTTISQATNYGFKLFDSSGAAMTISSVSLNGPSEVKIVASATVAANSVLEYGLQSTTPVGNEYSFRGNLRDNAGDTLTYNFAGTLAPLHNWSVIFSETIS